ncbi:MAG: 3-hydroxyacyl-CoA dehydrogenase family protein [Chromatiales bacterium]|jgi:3-hydroxyacyl-CoA dehydrogenase|nr:MAG: 3-hydroxyacyl-CoA dehydrogenase family protein [Chromatiales bacterium]
MSLDSRHREILASRKIDHVVVLGANGAMGYGSGALFTRVVPKVTFLARSREKAEQGLQAAMQAVRSPTVANRVQTGSYEADFDRAVASADLIFEALAEDFGVKRQIFERIDKVRRDDSIVATVTSGLSINKLADGRSPSFRQHFLGLHFFNPPNVIVGTELIAGEETDPQLVDFVDVYATKKLGRMITRTADKPGFAGNRVGFKVLNEVAQLAEEFGPVLADRIVGPFTGRAMAPLATIDLVGWDVHRAIVDNIHDNAPDEVRATLKLPEYMRRLIEQGTLGAKSGGGFFKTENNESFVLEPQSGAYVPVKSVKLPKLDFIREIAALHHVGLYRDAMKAFVTARGLEAELSRKVIAGYVSYAFHRVGEVTQSIDGIDSIMAFGFNWAPPGVLVDMIGLRPMIAMIEKARLPVPRVLSDALASGKAQRFFSNRSVNVGRFFIAA